MEDHIKKTNIKDDPDHIIFQINTNNNHFGKMPKNIAKLITDPKSYQNHSLAMFL